MELGESLRRVADFVETWPRACVLIGGFAIIARVRARPTRDADLIIVVEDDEIDLLLQHATEHGYSFPHDVDEWLEGGLLPLHAADGALPIDLLIADDAFLRSVAQRADSVALGDVSIPTATLEDLVLLKLLANRPIDIDDVLAIKDAFTGEMDVEYLVEQATLLGVAHELALYFGFE